MAEATNSGNIIEVFFSYSHRDEDLMKELVNHLSIMRRQKVISAWHDRRINPGTEWKGEIDEHLNTAHVILLLVSSDFLASDYCYDIEVARAMERHEAKEACVIPIILRPVDWAHAPFNKIQGLPKDAKPVTSWDNADEAFLDIAQGIRKGIEELSSSQASQSGASAQSSIRRIPHRRNLNFAGRESLLDGLHKTLASGQATAVTQAAVHGLGGIGKTQLALEYCYRYGDEYDVLWWVGAEEPATLSAEYASLAERLGLPEKDSTEQRVVVNAVRSWLENNSNWLLIFDNVEKPDDLENYLPSGTEGQIIITSRYADWRGVANPLSLNVFDRGESVDFLLSRTGYDDKEAAYALAEELGDLPLALEQAAAYMGQTGRSLSGYLDVFRQQRQEIIARGKPSTGYEYTVDTTWEIAFQEVEKASPVGADLLRLIAFLAPDDIPLSILGENAQNLPEPLSSALGNPVSIDEALATLLQYSLVEVADETLSLHRLVQAVTRDRMEEDDKKKWAEAAVTIINTAYPYEENNVATWEGSLKLLPHALAAAEHAETLGIGLEAAGNLLNKIGSYLVIRAEYPEARAALERALAIGEELLGLDHPDVAVHVNNLGRVLRELGDLQGARTHYQRALTIGEKSYGPDHPTVAIRVNNLGRVLRELGDLQGAKVHYERALNIDESAYGPDHPNVAIYANNLGDVLQGLGDLQGAQRHYQRALTIDKKTYGPDHPTVAVDVSNLGSVLQDLGDLQGAKAHLERALAIGENIYGLDHPTVAIRVSNLGAVLRELGDLQSAKAHYERALTIWRKFLGEDHPNTTIAKDNLEIVDAKINEEK